MTIDAADLQAQMGIVPVSGKPSYLAKRQIVKWQKEGALSDDVNTTDAVRLYMGLKACSSEPVTIDVFRNWNRTLSTSSTVKRRVWLVPEPNISDENRANVAPYLVEAVSFECPPGIDMSQYIVVDQSCNRAWLGLGLLELEVAVKVGRSQTGSASSCPGFGLVGGGSRSTLSEDGASAQVAPRTLTRQPSASDASAAEVIATHTKRLFASGKLCGGPSNHECVEFWMKQMSSHLESLKKEQQDTYLKTPETCTTCQNTSHVCKALFWWRGLLCSLNHPLRIGADQGNQTVKRFPPFDNRRCPSRTSSLRWTTIAACTGGS